MIQTFTFDSETSKKIRSWKNPEFASHERHHFKFFTIGAQTSLCAQTALKKLSGYSIRSLSQKQPLIILSSGCFQTGAHHGTVTMLPKPEEKKITDELLGCCLNCVSTKTILVNSFHKYPTNSCPVTNRKQTNSTPDILCSCNKIHIFVAPFIDFTILVTEMIHFQILYQHHFHGSWLYFPFKLVYSY